MAQFVLTPRRRLSIIARLYQSRPMADITQRRTSPVESLNMRCLFECLLLTSVLLAPCATGCQSPSHADQGALMGGLGGAGIGALVGNAVGKTGPGAAIGAGVGALTGAAIGNGMDEMEARNRALIEQRLQRRVSAGAVTIEDVSAMRSAGVADEVIVNHIRYHGMVRELTAQDLIALQQQGLSPTVIKAMQEPPPSGRETVLVSQASPRPVVVQEYYYRDPYGPYWRPYPSYGWGYCHPPPPGPRVGVGFSFR